MKTEGDSLVQLTIPFGLKEVDQPHIEPVVVAIAQEKPVWQEIFPVQPPSDVCIFPKGTAIYRVGGKMWGTISLGSQGAEVVAIDLTGKIRYQPKIHPFFLSLVSSAVFIEGRGDHEQVGGNLIQFRASRESGLKESRKLEAWQSWCKNMHKQGFTWDELKESALLKIRKAT